MHPKSYFWGAYQFLRFNFLCLKEKKYCKQLVCGKRDYYTVHLLQEIQYIIGDFEIENNALNMTFKNGRTFILKIGEVV